MYQRILFLLAVGTVALITHLIIRSKLNIEKQYIYEPVNKIDKYGGIAIWVIGLVAYAIAEFSNVFTTNSGVEPILYLMLINGFYSVYFVLLCSGNTRKNRNVIYFGWLAIYMV